MDGLDRVVREGTPPAVAVSVDVAAKKARPSSTETVRQLLRAAPREQLRFLIPSEEDSHTMQYLCIVFVLDTASQTGTGDLPLENAVERSRELISSCTGQALDDATIQNRLTSLERWGVVDLSIETGASISITKWSASYKRYRISKEGEMVMRLLEAAHTRQQNATGVQEAQSNLSAMAESLRSVARRIQDAAEDRKIATELRHAAWREAYIHLTRIKENDHRGLLEYLRDLNQRIIHFGRDQSPTDDLVIILDRLESYMAGIHREFQRTGGAIAAACRGLYEPDILDALRMGRDLAAARDTEDPLTMPRQRPEPEDLIQHVLVFFEDDGPGTLAAEVGRIANNCSAIVSRLRDYWQRLLDRSSNVQSIQLAWERISALDWDDPEWGNVALWTHRLHALQPIPTAPGLGDEAHPGKPPMPRRRRTYVIAQAQDVPVHRPDGEPEWVEDQVRALAARINAFVDEKILRGRSEGRVSELEVENQAAFRHLIDAVLHSNLVLNGPSSYYFTFNVMRRDGSPVEWSRGLDTFTAPELVFRAQPPRKKNQLEAPIRA